MPFEVMEAGKVGLLFSHKILKADGWGGNKDSDGEPSVHPRPQS
jgi:hypothetical protein